MSTLPPHPDEARRSDPQAEPPGEGGLMPPLEADEADEGPPLPPPPLPPSPSAIPRTGPRRFVNSHLSEASNATPSDVANREARRQEADEDRELITRAQQGDQAAFRSLVERHQRRAFVIAVGLVRDENDAREIVQEAFLRVYRSLGSFQGGSSFFTWLYRIVTNLAIDLMRKPGRKDAELLDNQTIDEDADFPLVSRIDGADPLDVMRRREIAARIQAALDALPPYHRGVILMREVEGMSYEEMAQAMGVSKGTIMSRLFHARQKLQRALQDCYAEEGERRAPAPSSPSASSSPPEPPPEPEDPS